MKCFFCVMDQCQEHLLLILSCLCCQVLSRYGMFERSTAVHSMYCLFPDKSIGKIDQHDSSNDDASIAKTFFSFFDKLSTIFMQINLLVTTSLSYTTSKLYQTSPCIYTPFIKADVAHKFSEEDIEAIKHVIVTTFMFHLNLTMTARFFKKMPLLVLSKVFDQTFNSNQWQSWMYSCISSYRKLLVVIDTWPKSHYVLESSN